MFKQVKPSSFTTLSEKASVPRGTRKARKPLFNGSSGCRSEVLMRQKFFLFVGLIAVLALTTPAQKNSPENPSGPNVTTRLSALESGLARYLGLDDETAALTRPRIAKETSAVEAKVIVNTVAVERLVFDIINKKRAESGLAPLEWSDGLAAVARLHSQNMADFQFFSHRGLDSKFVSDRADDLKLGSWRAIGENIAYNRGFQDPVAKAVELWLASRTHRQNMLDAGWKESAVGVAVADDGAYYFTQVFLVRK